MATSTKREDYLGRDLVTPASTSKDSFGRATTSSADFLGRALQRDIRANTTAVTLNQKLQFVTGGSKYTVSTAGTTAASEPAAPAVGATVTDGTAVLTRTK